MINWMTPLKRSFNTPFQFYDRKIKIVPVASKQAEQNVNGRRILR